MKLYYARGACSLSDRISLHEAGIAATFERVDLDSKRTESGEDFTAINPKGYVPLLVLDSGEKVTENIAILSWIAGQAPELAAPGPLGQVRLLEALAFISAELHHGFKPFFHAGSAAERAEASDATYQRLKILARTLNGPYLFGSRFTVADAYLFVILTWAVHFGVTIPVPLAQFLRSVLDRQSVRKAMAEEGLAVASLYPQPALAEGM